MNAFGALPLSAADAAGETTDNDVRAEKETRRSVLLMAGAAAAVMGLLAGSGGVLLATRGSGGFWHEAASKRNGTEKDKERMLELLVRDEWTVQPETGCKNWDELFLSLGSFTSADACGEYCMTLPGCQQFTYKFCEEMTNGNCMMFKGFGNASANVEKGDCGERAEKCWNRFTLKPSMRKPIDFCVKNRTGCQNWQELEISGFTDNWKKAIDCMAQCRRIKPCVAFNFHAEGAGQGTCMLFSNASCEPDGGLEWELYTACDSDDAPRQ